MDENEIDVGANEPIGEGTYNTSTQLSDVIEVIKETDPDFTESNNNQILHPRNQKLSQMFNGGGELPAAAAQPRPNVRRPQAYVKIIEQPAPKALRFRYECEGRSAGSLPGENSTPENKTYPEIQLVGFQGRAVVVVSCVTKDAPYKTHPHNLVGREGCKLGVCTMEIPTETMRVQFPNLGIQCVKKKQIERSLRQREQIKVDPFRQGYHHRDQPTSIDLNAVRLCFQVFLEGAKTNKFTVALPPVVSNVIYDKKAMSDLTIVKLSDCVSYVDGGRKDILLACEKVAKEDIQIRFYEEKDSQVVWEGYADFQPSQVFKQHVIWFRTPRYRTLEVTEPVKVFIQLRRPSDGQTSEPLPFELLPMDSVTIGEKPKRKRAKILGSLGESNKQLQPLMNISPMDTIKQEPPHDATSPYGGSIYGGVSPNYTPSPGVNAISPQSIVDSYDPIMFGQFNPVQPDVASSSNWNIQPGTLNIDFSQPGPPTIDFSNLPSTSTSMMGNHQNIPSYFNLDTQQVNSAELASTIDRMGMLTDGEQLLEIKNLSLSDITMPESGANDQNMTDSLTRFTNEAVSHLLDG